jgi:electron transfer flavoprotein alpha/beta subunit
MAATFQVIAVSSLDPDGSDTRNEPMLLYPDALETARQLKSEGKAFRVIAEGDQTEEQLQSFLALGALV